MMLTDSEINQQVKDFIRYLGFTPQHTYFTCYRYPLPILGLIPVSPIMTALHAIFFDKFDNWTKFLQTNGRRIRTVVKKEVKKFRECGNPEKSSRLLVCEGCHAVKKLVFRCKGKFFPTCATGESQRWAEITANDLFMVAHRHAVFTIAEGLRPIFMMEKYY